MLGSAAPGTLDEFRKRFELLNISIEVSKLKNPGHPLLEDSDEKVWDNHVRYMLGPNVMKLKTTNDDGVVVKTPSWNLVLNYNQAILNKVATLMNEGLPNKGGVASSLHPGVYYLGKPFPPIFFFVPELWVREGRL